MPKPVVLVRVFGIHLGSPYLHQGMRKIEVNSLIDSSAENAFMVSLGPPPFATPPGSRPIIVMATEDKHGEIALIKGGTLRG